MTNVQLPVEVKTCKQCGISKPVSRYRKFGKGKKYYYPYCKDCVLQQQTKYYHAKRIETPVEDLEGEIWKDVIGYEGLYQVSNYARIKRMPVAVPHAHSGYLRRKEELLTQNINSHGYRKVIFSKNGIHEVQQVHLIVWDAFGDKDRVGNLLVVDHKDNNKEHNWFSNLQCVTQRVNSSKDRKRVVAPYQGICFHKKSGKWQAKIQIMNCSKSLGLYHTPEAAAEAYKKARAECDKLDMQKVEALRKKLQAAS